MKTKLVITDNIELTPVFKINSFILRVYSPSSSDVEFVELLDYKKRPIRIIQDSLKEVSIPTFNGSVYYLNIKTQNKYSIEFSGVEIIEEKNFLKIIINDECPSVTIKIGDLDYQFETFNTNNFIKAERPMRKNGVIIKNV